MNLSRLSWYWHRLRAMSPAEMGAHLRKKVYQFTDARRERDWSAVPLESGGAFPRLPAPADAPTVLREALRRDAEDILAGRWRAFGHLEIKVDDPPQWHKDYLVGKNLTTTESAFKLNHRELPDGADIKLIWELSRWHQLVRLAQAGYVLGDVRAAQTCVRWLQDWVAHNPPFRGWNWTSALEAGMRLVQFTWIDALLCGQAAAWNLKTELERLRLEILPPHTWFTWRHMSFGSSANNHLLGELAGLTLATARWPGLAKIGASVEELQKRWEHEVLAQFAEDGGNKEQALNYHLFSFEFCWQTRLALQAAGRKIADEVEDRLSRVVEFFHLVCVSPGWDYGDSDGAWVTPFFAPERGPAGDWKNWMTEPSDDPINYWIGDPPDWLEPHADLAGENWWFYRNTGIGIGVEHDLTVRWDLSSLGYLTTAAHGHADALHLSIWFREEAIVIDPGTGAYYANPALREWLASRPAHNGPCPSGEASPKRLGPFLWSSSHPKLAVSQHEGGVFSAELALPQGIVRRKVHLLAYDGPPPTGAQLETLMERLRSQEPREEAAEWNGDDLDEAEPGLVVEDEFHAVEGMCNEFYVRWQFAPECRLDPVAERTFRVRHQKDESIVVLVDIGDAWSKVELVTEGKPDQAGASRLEPADWEGIVSPAFRKTVFAPYLKLTARSGNKPCVFRTTFLASSPS